MKSFDFLKGYKAVQKLRLKDLRLFDVIKHRPTNVDCSGL